MPRSRKILWDVVLPIFIFLPLSVAAIELLFGHLIKAGLIKSQELCPIPIEGRLPFQLKYLGGYAPPIENTLCVLVSFFHPLFQKEAADSTRFVNWFLASLGSCVVIPLLEASRANRPFLLGFPLVLGGLYQRFTGGFIFPLYWIMFLATTRDRAAGSQIDQANAEAIIFGLVMGFILPSVAMTHLATPGPIALWQGFPLLISIFQHLHLLFRPSKKHSSSGYLTVQATYIMTFIMSAIVHFQTMSTYNFSLRALADGLLPSFEIPAARKGHTALTSSLHLLQWDAVFLFGSTFLASLWFSRSIMQGILLIVWTLLSCVILGPGAAVSGIFLWREAKLNQARLKQLPAIKLAKAQ